MPSSNARWQSTSSCVAPYMCKKVVYFPNVNFVALPFGKGQRSVDRSRCNLGLKNCRSPFLGRLTCSDAIGNTCFFGFLAHQCLLQACCIACCHCVGCCSPYHTCVILGLHLRRHLTLKHDFQVQNIRCKRNVSYQKPWLIVGSRLDLKLNRLMGRPLSEISVRLHDRPQKQASREPCAQSHKNPRRRIGGGNIGKINSFSQFSDHMVPSSAEVDQESVFRYVAHVDEVELHRYPSPQFVHTRVPLNELFTFLPVSHARKIAAVHGISAGSRCTAVQLMMFVENHSCL